MPKAEAQTEAQIAFNQQVGALLKSMRLKRGWSLRRFAELLGEAGAERNGTTTVYNWEEGDRRIPMDMLPFFAKVFDVEIRDLIPEMAL